MGEQFKFAFPQPVLPLDSLFLDSEGESALRILRQWKNWPKCFVGLVGPERSGVTTVLKSWASDVGGQYLVPDDWQDEDAAEVSRLLAKPLAIDDADQIASPSSLLTLINLAVENGSVLLLGGHKQPQNWQSHPPDLVSRLTAMTTIQLPNLSNDESFRKRLRAACLRRFVRIPEETLSFVEPRLERSYQAIEAFANELDEAMSLTSRPASIPLAREVLNKFSGFDDPEDI